jgi:DNA-binding response OmpR family regulator
VSESQSVDPPATILVVDDDPHIVRLVSLYLRRAGYNVIPACNGAEALQKVREQAPDLVLLDIMLPGSNGLDLCRSLRLYDEVPIVLLSARGTDIDKIMGLQSGADDYITKPFHPLELVARVQSVLRRTRQRSRLLLHSTLSLGKVRLDLDERRASISDQPLQLKPKEFDLLATFIRLEGFVLERNRLLDLVWDSNYAGDSRTVDVHVAWLRDKLAGSGLKIVTMRGVGYQLVEESRETASLSVADR